MQHTFIIMVLAVLLTGCTRSKHVDVTLTTFPCTNQMQMQAGDSCEFRLPSGNTVAIWCLRPKSSWMSSDADVDSKSGLKTVWGERAFRKPEEILRKSGPNSYTHVGWKSYIAQGTVTIEGYTARHYDLSTDGMQFSIREDLSATNSLPITVIVRKN